MKKMLFTAIALVAFAGTSMANTIEVENEEVKLETNKDLKKEELEATPCQELMLDTYEFIMDEIRGGGDDIGLLNSLLSNYN